MRRLITALIFSITAILPLHAPPTTQLLQKSPSYAKWGQLAMKETSKKYPDASIIDYLHEGNESAGNVTIEKFKLWLSHQGKEFGVFVRITYNTDTEKVISIQFKETQK